MSLLNAFQPGGSFCAAPGTDPLRFPQGSWLLPPVGTAWVLEAAGTLNKVLEELLED